MADNAPIAHVFNTWREILPVHPACKILPRHSDTELRDLGRNIKASGGMKLPVIVLVQPDGTRSLLDGRSRLDAMVHVGINFQIKMIDRHVVIDAPGFDIPTPSEIPAEPNFDALTFVLAINMHHRHITNEVKRAIIKNVIEAQPNLSDNAVAKMVSVSDKTVNSVRKELKANSEIRIRVEATGRRARGRKPGQKTVEATESFINGKTGSEELSLEQHRARMAALAGKPEPGWIAEYRAQTEAINEPAEVTTGTIDTDTAAITAPPPAAPKTKPKPTASDGFPVSEALAVARKVQEILHRPVSAPNNEAARNQIKRLIDLLLAHKTLKPTAGKPARAA
jgi:hypothetical protein